MSAPSWVGKEVRSCANARAGHSSIAVAKRTTANVPHDSWRLWTSAMTGLWRGIVRMRVPSLITMCLPWLTILKPTTTDTHFSPYRSPTAHAHVVKVGSAVTTAAITATACKAAMTPTAFRRPRVAPQREHTHAYNGYCNNARAISGPEITPVTPVSAMEYGNNIFAGA